MRNEFRLESKMNLDMTFGMIEGMNSRTNSKMNFGSNSVMLRLVFGVIKSLQKIGHTMKLIVY